MNLDELRSVQSAERESDALQHLRDGFYRDAGEYVEQLREQRRRAAEDAVDPYGDAEVRRLTDEIETAKAVTEAIWEARIGKILRIAGLTATDMSASADGLTPEEAALFERVVEAIETNRETIQGALETAESTPPTPERGQTATGKQAGAATGDDEDAPLESDPADEDTEAVDDESTGPGDDDRPASSDEPAETVENASETSGADDGRVRVRITQDVGTIAGVDGREYHLATDDVAELPDANARPLLERDAAQRIE